MRKIVITILALVLQTTSGLIFATDNAILTCYDGKLPAPAQLSKTEIFVLIDQTTLLDDGLKQSVANQVRPFLAAGNSFSVIVFSAFTQGKYTQVVTSGRLDQALSKDQRNAVSKPLLVKHDQCMLKQPALAAQVVGQALRSAFDGSSGDIAKSEVMGSLKDIAGKVRQSQASEKLVLVVSDMLENSSVSSFYANQAVRRIDPEREMKIAIDNKLLANFEGARIYVLGAGLLPEDVGKNKKAHRDVKTMQALSTFWNSYFEKSAAKLLDFGQPALLNQIK